MASINLGLASLTVSGSLSITGTTLSLVNDSTAPGNSYYYGTDSSGAKGWFTLASGGALPSQTGNSGRLLTTNGTSASWTTTATLTSLTGPTTTDLTLSGGSSGASVVLGQGTNGAINLTPAGTGETNAYRTSATTYSTAGNANVVLAVWNTNTTANNSAQISFATNDGSSIRGGATIGALFAARSSGASVTGILTFATNSAAAAVSERMRLTDLGNLLIGGTTDISGTGGLKVFGTTAATNTTSGAVQVGSNIGLSGNSGGPSYFGGNLTVNGGISALGQPVLPAAWSGSFGIGLDGTFATGATRRIFFGDGTGYSLAFTRRAASVSTDVFTITDAGAVIALGAAQFGGTTSASSSTTGALTIGNGTAATNVGIGGGNINAGGTITAGGNLTVNGTQNTFGLPATASALAVNSAMTFELTSNTSLTIKVRGTDGTTRSVALTLAP